MILDLIASYKNTLMTFVEPTRAALLITRGDGIDDDEQLWRCVTHIVETAARGFLMESVYRKKVPLSFGS
jgi:hypothetical protein